MGCFYFPEAQKGCKCWTTTDYRTTGLQGTGYFLGQFYPDMWFFWTRLQAEGGTKKFGNHWPKVMIFLCSPNNKRQAFSVWTIHEGYFDIKRIAVWDFDNFFNSCFQLFIFFSQNHNKLKVAIFPIEITKPNTARRAQVAWIAFQATWTCLSRFRRALCWQTNATYDVIWRKMGFWLMRALKCIQNSHDIKL